MTESKTHTGKTGRVWLYFTLPACCTAPYLYCCTAGRQGTCNQEVYHHIDPPSYHLSDIHPSTRIALFSGKCNTLLGETYWVDRGGQTLCM
jgi:hypothetical protein